jgi:hypothetical protein
MRYDEECDFCGSESKPYGFTLCVRCGERKCVENCVPGGNRTACTDCEEKEDMEAGRDQ